MSVAVEAQGSAYEPRKPLLSVVADETSSVGS
jgi:hypothetical protein